MRENIRFLVFWARLTSLRMMKNTIFKKSGFLKATQGGFLPAVGKGVFARYIRFKDSQYIPVIRD
jgi:hypothetical protein